ncbi:MAG: anti-sigma factor antagonist [Methylococcus sp.]|jgi:anti-anti-sigma factor|nr:MAG: anti-sigma factor antagonist [Methylococcus sp.]
MYMKTEQLDNGLKRVALSGRFDLPSVVEQGDAFTAFTTGDDSGVIVDLSGVDFMASVAIRLLITCAKAKAARGGKFVMHSADPLILDALDVSGITQLIPILPDYPAAEAAVRSKSP